MKLLCHFTIPAQPNSPSACLHVQESQVPDQVHIYADGESGVYLSKEAFTALCALGEKHNPIISFNGLSQEPSSEI